MKLLCVGNSHIAQDIKERSCTWAITIGKVYGVRETNINNLGYYPITDDRGQEIIVPTWLLEEISLARLNREFDRNGIRYSVNGLVITIDSDIDSIDMNREPMTVTINGVIYLIPDGYTIKVQQVSSITM